MNKVSVVKSAKEFARRFNPDGLVPFPFDETISTLGDIRVSYFEPNNNDVSGALYLDKGEYVIIVNSSKPPKRQYFTLAHEMGHYWLHKDKLQKETVPGFIDFSLLDNTSSLLRTDEMPEEIESLQVEREANTFAAEILMPEDKVREFFMLNGDVKETADAFQVSVAAMAVRLEKLGLV